MLEIDAQRKLSGRADWLENISISTWIGFSDLRGNLFLMAQMVTRTEVLSAYRHLLRSVTVAFQGDVTILSAAKKEARARFEIGRKLAAESPEALERVAAARSVAKFLRQNLVQGVKDGNEEIYRMSLSIHAIIARITDT